MYSKRLLLSAFAISTLCGFAQDPAQALREAERLADLYNWYDALPHFEAAEQAFRASGDRRNEAYARIGRLRGQMQVLPLPDLADTLERELQTELVRNDPKLRLLALIVLSDVRGEIDVAATREAWESVLTLAKEIGDRRWQSRASGELGFQAFLDGDTAAAKELVGGALLTATMTGDVGAQIRYLGAVGSGLLMRGELPEAMRYFDQAIGLAEKHPDTGFPYTPYWGKSRALMGLKRYAEAERLVELALGKAANGERRVKESQMLIVAAKLRVEQDEVRAAIPYLEKAAEIATVGGFRRLLGKALFDLAEVYRLLGDLPRAEAHAARAIAASAQVGDRYFLPFQIEALAKLKEAQRMYAEADQLYQRAHDVIEGAMLNVPSALSAAALVSVMSSVYTSHFRLAIEGLKDTGKAFDVIERARGRSINDSLRGAQERVGWTPDHKAVAIREEFGRLQAKLLVTAQPRERASVLASLWDAEQRLHLLDGEKFVSPGSRSKPISLRALRAALTPDEVLLEYVVAAPKSFCIAIMKESTTAHALIGKADLETMVGRFLDAVKAKPGSAEERTLAGELRAAILDPVPEWPRKRKITVVADGVIHGLPLGSLVDQSGRRIMDSHVVTFTPSATAHVLLRQAPPGNPDLPLLAVGDVPYTSIAGARGSALRPTSRARGLYDVVAAPVLAPLPQSRYEVEQARRLAGGESVVLLGDEATESNLKGQPIERFQVIHFAVHGYADPQVPQRAALVLKGDPKTSEDGLLQPREISRLPMRAKLVVLSACSTAIGRSLGQEGVANLARAFLLGGAQAVVLTLWSVSDEGSSALMESFYRNIAAGSDVATAMRDSKLALLKQFGPAALPAVSAFQLVGNGAVRIEFQQRAKSK